MPEENSPVLSLKVNDFLEDSDKSLNLSIFGETIAQDQRPTGTSLSFFPPIDSSQLELKVAGSSFVAEAGDLPPLFSEEKTYRISMEIPPGEDKEDYKLDCGSGLKEKNFSWVGSEQRILSGIFNTGSRVGIATFKVFRKGGLVLKFDMEIFPSKMDYQDDFLKMVNEIISITYELALDFDKFTSLPAKKTDKYLPTDKVWFSILKEIFEGIVEAFNIVSINPSRRFKTRKKKVPPAKVRRAETSLRKWISRNQGKLESCQEGAGLIEIGGKEYTVRQLPEERKINSVDTIENRFLKHTLRQIKTKFRRFKNKYGQYSANKSSSAENKGLIERMNSMLETIDNLQRYDFVEQASELRTRNFSSLVLQMAPGYKTIYKYYFLLQKGLELQGKPFDLYPKDVSELYEYWCYLKIIQLLKNNEKAELRVSSDELVQVTSNGIRLNLSDSGATKVDFFEEDGDRFTLHYNWSDSNEYAKEKAAQEKHLTTFNYSFLENRKSKKPTKNPTGENRPDIMLEVSKKDPSTDKRYPATLRFLFDAKYKQDERHEVLGPKTEDINTMHRYRDAIISRIAKSENKYSSRYIRKTINALVLFPLGGKQQGDLVEDYQNQHEFFRSIGEVGIGGLPFLPATTTLVDAILDDWLTYHPEQFRDRRIRQLHPDEIDWYNERNKDVLIGVVPNNGTQKQRWKLITENTYYHMPAEQATQRKLSVDYIAFFFPQDTNENLDATNYPGGHIQYYAKVNNTKIVNRKEIPITSSRKSQPEEPYVKFLLEPQIHKLDHPIVNKDGDPVTFRFGTLYTLKRARTLPELYLTDPNLQKEWLDVKQKNGHIRPYVAGWKKDNFGNYDAKIEFEKKG